MPLPSRIGRLRPPVLCLVVSKADAKEGELDDLVKNAVAGGVNIVQLRDRSLPAGELLEVARLIKRATRGKALVVINDRADVAQVVEADGLHLPEDGLPTRAARQLIGRYAVLGRSVHDAEAAREADQQGAEYVIAGTIYKSTSHPEGKPVGPGLITEMTKNSSFPVIAIGGITADKVAEVVKAGAAGVAVISAITKAEDPKAAAEELVTALKEAWSQRTSDAAAAGEVSAKA